MLQLSGKEIPFGATASIKNRDNLTDGIVDERQRVWLNGAPEKGTVEVNWAGESCRATYQIPSFSDTTHYVTAPCH